MEFSKFVYIYLKPLLTKRNSSNTGFTIVEVLIVVLIIGILSAIVAPGWDAFITRQRIRTVNSQVLQALQKAQSQAKLKKENVVVNFDNVADPPTVSLDGIEQNLNANGEIKAGMVELVSGVCTDENCTAFTASTNVTFDYLGAVDENSVPFIVTISTPDRGLRRCVIIQTIIGGMRTAEDTDCP